MTVALVEVIDVPIPPPASHYPHRWTRNTGDDRWTCPCGAFAFELYDATGQIVRLGLDG